jgi:hypothetical protein
MACMTFRRLRQLLILVCTGFWAFAGHADSQSRQDFSCSQGAMKRVVSIITLDPSGRQPRGSCRVDYTKDGTAKTVWSSVTSHAYCVKQATALVTKLVESHYSCSLQTVEQPDK